MEDSPKFSNISGKGDVCVQNDDPLQIGRQRLGEHQLHQTVDPRVMFVRDPRHLALKHTDKGWGSFDGKWTEQMCSLHNIILKDALQSHRASDHQASASEVKLSLSGVKSAG